MAQEQPTAWESIIGQKQLTDNLRNALKYNKISHAYMIQGEKMSGKHMIADVFARALQCESDGIRPCNQCRSCKQAINNNHPDIIYILDYSDCTTYIFFYYPCKLLSNKVYPSVYFRHCSSSSLKLQHLSFTISALYHMRTYVCKCFSKICKKRLELYTLTFLF